MRKIQKEEILEEGRREKMKAEGRRNMSKLREESSM